MTICLCRFRNKQAAIFQILPSGQTESIGQQTDDSIGKRCQRSQSRNKQKPTQTRSAAKKSGDQHNHTKHPSVPKQNDSTALHSDQMS